MKFQQILELKTSVESMFSTDLWLDFEVVSYHSHDGDALVIAASRDFTYYHNLEIKFSGVRYFSGALSWRSSPSKNGIIAPLQGDSIHRPTNVPPADDTDAAVEFINDDDLGILVLASCAVVNLDTVYYYNRDSLGPNERIADWVNNT